MVFFPAFHFEIVTSRIRPDCITRHIRFYSATSYFEILKNENANTWICLEFLL